MTSTVYHITLNASYKKSLPDRLKALVRRAGMDRIVSDRDLTAVKLHFGEPGGTAFVRPVFVRAVADTVRQAGGEPFLTDTNTLYVGCRSTAPAHLTAAVRNGFAYAVTDTPVLIADGLRGQNAVAVPIDGKHFREVSIAADIVHADALVSIAHFKGHELAGFGGSLKNIGMGTASRQGKLAQHCDVAPKVKRKRCVACGHCVDQCSAGAISQADDGKAVIDGAACIGCGACILACPNGAVQIQWCTATETFQEKMVEYASGALAGKKGKVLFVNFITQVSPACDCVPYSDAPIVRDVGIVAGTDPVALDQASVDLVNQQSGLPDSCLKQHHAPGEDKFRGLYPAIDWSVQLDYAAALGLGTRAYQLKTL